MNKIITNNAYENKIHYKQRYKVLKSKRCELKKQKKICN